MQSRFTKHSGHQIKKFPPPVKFSPINSPKVKGTTDVGDLSWMVPTTGLRTATWIPGRNIGITHGRPRLSAGMGIGMKGMMNAAKTIAGTS